MRTVPGQSRDEIVATTRDLLDAVAARTGLPVRTQVEVPVYADPIVTPPDHPLVRAAVAAVTEVRGQAPLVGGIGYGTDAVLLAPAYGLPVVVCGPGRFEQAHQTDEYVEVAELIQAVRAYLRLAHLLLG